MLKRQGLVFEFHILYLSLFISRYKTGGGLLEYYYVVIHKDQLSAKSIEILKKHKNNMQFWCKNYILAKLSLNVL